MTQIVKMVGGLVLGGALYGAATVMETKQENEAIADLGLNEQQVSFMHQCKDLLSRYEKKFNHAGKTDGCACMAKNLGEDLRPSDMDFAGELFKVQLMTFDDRAKGPELLVSAFDNSGLAISRADMVAGKFMEANTACLSKDRGANQPKG